MLPPKLLSLFNAAHQEFPRLTEENFGRIMLLYHGLNYKKQHSFPDHFTHFELIFSAPHLSSLAILTLLNPDSPFELLDGDEPGQHILLFENQFVDIVADYEQRPFDFRKEEPFYFYVTELNGDLVLKLNPIQLCDFFQNTTGQLPCGFCFRNDMVQRFKNITAEELVKLVLEKEYQKDKHQTLKQVDEISIVTGSYKSDQEYADEVSTLVSGLKPHISSQLRVVVGSHEGKEATTLRQLKAAGVTVFAFPVESLDDETRLKEMKNRKGEINSAKILESILTGIDIFGPEGVIVRLVAGMGDTLDASFEDKIRQIATYSQLGSPVFNINQYMPFTHYHWRLFQKARPYDLHYMFKYCDILNQYVPIEKQLRFKVSP